MSHVCAVVGAKGGTTKTATVAALGEVLSSLGLSVVLVDCDPQGSLTRRTGYARVPAPLQADPVSLPCAASKGVLQLFRGGRALEVADEQAVDSHIHRARALEAHIVIIDTPPALGPIVRAAMRPADLILVPCTPGSEALDGMRDIMSIASSLSPDAVVRGFLALVHTRSRLFAWSVAAFDEQFPGLRYQASIPSEVAAGEAGTLGMSVTASTPASRSARAYRKISSAVLFDLDSTRAGES